MIKQNITQSLLLNKEFIFVNNKYLQHYANLIVKCKNKNRKKLKKNNLEYIYYEAHHILPRSLNGHNAKENVVLFTPREHLIAHWLLSKCTSGNAYYKMINALHYMFTGNNKGRNENKIRLSRVYEKNRIEFSKCNSGKNHHLLGKKRPDHSAKMRGVFVGRKITKKQKNDVSEGLKKFYTTEEGIERKKNISNNKKGKSIYRTKSGKVLFLNPNDPLVLNGEVLPITFEVEPPNKIKLSKEIKDDLKNIFDSSLNLKECAFQFNTKYNTTYDKRTIKRILNE